MRFRHDRFALVGLPLLASMIAGFARAGATINLSAPTAGQNYAVNANLAYSGNVTWTRSTPYLDKVLIDYVWTNGGNNLAAGGGTIVTTEQAENINYALNTPGDLSSGGSSGFDNPPAPPNPALKATQYTMPGPGGQPQTTTYWIRATPYSGSGNKYTNAQGVTLYATVKLGTVS